jgi:hypothetical protein
MMCLTFVRPMMVLRIIEDEDEAGLSRIEEYAVV